MPIPTEPSKSPIISPTPEANLPSPVSSVRIAEPNYKDVAVDTRWSPIQSLMTHIEGANWVVTYYSQVIDTDSQLAPQAPTTSAVYQQYTRIRDLKLKVTSALEEEQDEETKTMKMRGNAIVFAGVTPNEGDMFSADIGMSRVGVFLVKSSRKKSIFKESAYEIEYEFSSTDQHYIDDLEAKTVKELVFVEDYLNRGAEPVILEEEAVLVTQVQACLLRYGNRFFDNFFSNEFKTYVLPGQSHSVYDPFVTEFISRHFTTQDSMSLMLLRKPNFGDDAAIEQHSFWDALDQRDIHLLKNGFTKTKLVSSLAFRGGSVYNSVRYTGINLCVYPADPRIGVRGLTSAMLKEASADTIDDTTPHTFYNGVPAPAVGDDSAINRIFPEDNKINLLPPGTVDAQQTVPLRKVTHDAFYVFSEDFYTGAAGMSVFESTVRDFILGKSIDIKHLVKSEKLCDRWGALEQFYYIPIIMFILRSYLQDHKL